MLLLYELPIKYGSNCQSPGFKIYNLQNLCTIYKKDSIHNICAKDLAQGIKKEHFQDFLARKICLL